MSTELNRVIELAINGDLPGGQHAALLSKTSSNSAKDRIYFMAGDCFTLRLFFRKPSTAIGAASSVYHLAAGMSLVASGKKDDPIITGDELFRISDWAAIGAGDTIYYQAAVDLNTAEIAALIATGDDEVPVAMDIEYRDAANANRLTWRVNIILCRQVYAGTGPAPSTLSASYLQSPDGSNWQLSLDDNGQLSIIKVGDEQADPDYVILSYATLVSPGGYWWRMTVTDEGQLDIGRIQ